MWDYNRALNLECVCVCACMCACVLTSVKQPLYVYY